MKWYPIIQSIICCVATINRVYGLITRKNNFVLMMIQAIFDSSEGIFIIIVFLFIPEYQNNLKVCCNKFFSKKKKNKIHNSTILLHGDNSFSESHLSLDFATIDETEAKSKNQSIIR